MVPSVFERECYCFDLYELCETFKTGLDNDFFMAGFQASSITPQDKWQAENNLLLTQT
jgi:hypothetical protein